MLRCKAGLWLCKVKEMQQLNLTLRGLRRLSCLLAADVMLRSPSCMLAADLMLRWLQSLSVS